MNTTQSNFVDDFEGESAPPIDLLPVLVHLLKAKRSMLAGLLIGVALGLIASFVWPASYISSTEILPPQQKPSGASAVLSELNAGAAALNSATTDFQSRSVAETYVHMIRSSPVLDALINRYDLRRVYHRRYMVDARKVLLAHVNVEATKEGFVSIAVRDHDADRAAIIANDFVQQLRTVSDRLLLTESSQRRLFYEGQLSKSKEDLAASELAFKRVQQAHGVVALDAQARVLIESVSQLKAQIAAREVELQRLHGYATGNNPQVQGVEDELRALRGQLAGAEASGGSGSASGGLGSVPAIELDFVRTSREVRYQETVYELLMKQYEIARMDEAREAPAVQILQVATPAERPAWPNPIALVSFMAAIGLVIAAGWSLLQYARQSLSPERSQKVQQLLNALWGWS